MPKKIEDAPVKKGHKKSKVAKAHQKQAKHVTASVKKGKGKKGKQPTEKATRGGNISCVGARDLTPKQMVFVVKKINGGASQREAVAALEEKYNIAPNQSTICRMMADPRLPKFLKSHGFDIKVKA